LDWNWRLIIINFKFEKLQEIEKEDEIIEFDFFQFMHHLSSVFQLQKAQTTFFSNHLQTWIKRGKANLGMSGGEKRRVELFFIFLLILI
jgi:Fe-S cluster assembly ATPase SufC